MYFQVKIDPEDSKIMKTARIMISANESSELRSVESTSPCNLPSPDESEEGARGLINNLWADTEHQAELSHNQAELIRCFLIEAWITSHTQRKI